MQRIGRRPHPFGPARVVGVRFTPDEATELDALAKQYRTRRSTIARRFYRHGRDAFERGELEL